jgi:2-polyprenyl-6-methoxyphenol hydroxylase-like FAD-dependent oxidoreductase
VRIAIVGAGLAGLTLAQRLVTAGAAVTVFERDAGPDVRGQGFRITVDEHGFGALRACLPAGLHERVLATAGPPGGFFRITDERLRDAVVVRFDPATTIGRQVDRQTLRSILLTGLDGVVRWGTPVPALEPADGGVAVLGERFDFAVVADGIGSVLRRAVHPAAEPVDLGVGGIYGRTPLRVDGTALLPERLHGSGILALLPRPGLAFFVTAMRFPGDRPDYLMWGVVTDEVPADPAAAARAAVAPAHPALRAVVEHTEPGQLLFSRFAAGRITGPSVLPPAAVLGDAIHPMPPLGAHGGNTALRDAHTLAEALLASPADLPGAAARYHAAMTGYATAAVRSAERQTRRLARGGPSTWVLRRALPVLRRTLRIGG